MNNLVKIRNYKLVAKIQLSNYSDFWYFHIFYTYLIFSEQKIVYTPN